jgi:hypothetical protein
MRVVLQFQRNNCTHGNLNNYWLIDGILLKYSRALGYRQAAMLVYILIHVASMLIIELSGTAVESKFSESKLFLSLVVNQFPSLASCPIGSML